MEIIADVGGTRGRWILINKTTIKKIETSGFNPYSHKISSLNHHLDTIKTTINDEKISKITYYGSGINNNEMTDIVKRSIDNHFPGIEIDVFSDLLGSCRALCDKKNGIVSILGTGSNSCYYDGDNINMQINSLGYLLGDEGSGYALGRSFLKKYLRGEFNEEISKSFEDEYDLRKENFKLVYEKNSHRWISRISEFIYKNKEDKLVKDLVTDHFNYYFSEIISKYSSKNLYLSGSIAYFFEKDIRDVSNKFKINVIKIIRDPINHLVKFHVK